VKTFHVTILFNILVGCN